MISHCTLIAQTTKPIIVNVFPEKDNHPISNYIYGSNGQSDDHEENITARRIGGNRLTGYNWENNASNAGTDYLNHSDDYLPWVSGITGADAKKPAIVITAFHDTSIAMNCYSLVTLQAAGYVAGDINGTVAQSETAPSVRWKEVKFSKGSAFLTVPDTSDMFVAIDEEVQFLVNNYGHSNEPRGIRGYEIDNEPGLWSSTHPRIHPAQPTVAEYISRSSAIARSVKTVDPNVEMFGGVMYGYNEYLSFQNAPDWNIYKSYGTYINAYLSNMKDSSDKAGKRLLDVLDLHWYPEAQGADRNGSLVRITQSQVADSGVAVAREQAPRSLWDSSYKENSWIGQYFSPVALLPSLKASISRYNPGTKLAFTEINYGGDSSISGAIAMADVLGLFGKYDVYFSSYWGSLVSYVSSAYKLYRNFDGATSTFGNISCQATVGDPAAASVYAATNSNDSSSLHIMLINKGFAASNCNITINSSAQYTTAERYSLFSNSPEIIHSKSVYPIASNSLTFIADPQSITHLVLKRNVPSKVEQEKQIPLLNCASDLNGGVSLIYYRVTSNASVRIVDLNGKVVKQYENLNDSGHINFAGASGIYEVILTEGLQMAHQKIVITH